ncbi:MAG: hypothetical protein OJF48_001640 [Afipia sp.]|nr:MAG: hypothetical protein OJF48_001640 [Afipia sp.]
MSDPKLRLSGSPLRNNEKGHSGVASHSKQIMNEHYLFHMCSATP